MWQSLNTNSYLQIPVIIFSSACGLVLGRTSMVQSEILISTGSIAKEFLIKKNEH